MLIHNMFPKFLIFNVRDCYDEKVMMNHGRAALILRLALV